MGTNFYMNISVKKIAHFEPVLGEIQMFLRDRSGNGSPTNVQLGVSFEQSQRADIHKIVLLLTCSLPTGEPTHTQYMAKSLSNAMFNFTMGRCTWLENKNILLNKWWISTGWRGGQFIGHKYYDICKLISDLTQLRSQQCIINSGDMGICLCLNKHFSINTCPY